MSDSLEIELNSRDQARKELIAQVFPFLARVLAEPSRWVLIIKRRTRTPRQNRRYWGNGVLAQIATQARIRGRAFDAEVWHEQFKRMFIGVVELPNGQVIGKSSTELTTVEFAEFCDRVEAYAATELGVTFYDLAPRTQGIEARKPAQARHIADEVVA
jgi:NinB protein